MLIVTWLFFILALIDWLYLGVRLLDAAATPNGGLAAYAIATQMGTASIVLAICSVGALVGRRLDKAQQESLSFRENLLRRLDALASAISAAARSPGERVGPTESTYRTAGTATREIGQPPAVIKLNDRGIFIMARNSDGRLDDFRMLIQSMRGDWVDGRFGAFAVSGIKAHNQEALTLSAADIRRIGDAAETMTKDVTEYLHALAVEARTWRGV